jgi:hypothetical protein
LVETVLVHHLIQEAGPRNPSCSSLETKAVRNGQLDQAVLSRGRGFPDSRDPLQDGFESRRAGNPPIEPPGRAFSASSSAIRLLFDSVCLVCAASRCGIGLQISATSSGASNSVFTLIQVRSHDDGGNRSAAGKTRNLGRQRGAPPRRL